MKVATYQDASGDSVGCDTFTDARDSAASCYDDARADAHGEGEWGDGVEDIGWGIVVDHVAEAASGSGWVDYDLVEHEGLVGVLTDLLRSRPELWAAVRAGVEAP